MIMQEQDTVLYVLEEMLLNVPAESLLAVLLCVDEVAWSGAHLLLPIFSLCFRQISQSMTSRPASTQFIGAVYTPIWQAVTLSPKLWNDI